MYTGQQLTCLVRAAEYTRLGYSIGLTKEKRLIRPFYPDDDNGRMDDWDGISIRLRNALICVDFDTLDMDLGWHFLPPTLKERSPRGWHLFYRAPYGSGMATHGTPQIKWKGMPVDLLCDEGAKGGMRIKRSTRYGTTREEEDQEDEPAWKPHVLVSPTPGYRRIYPDTVPHVMELTVAPDWLVEAVTHS